MVISRKLRKLYVITDNFYIILLELVFDKVVWTIFSMGFSTETSVGKIRICA